MRLSRGTSRRRRSGGILAIAGVAGTLLLTAPGTAAADVRTGVQWTARFAKAEYAQLAGLQGAEIARLPVSWNAVSPRPPGAPGPRYDWSRYDTLVERLARNGVAVMINLFGTAAWASEVTRQGAPITRRPAVASRRDDWRRFVRAVVRRYGPGGSFWLGHAIRGDRLPYHPVRNYEIWNEPNLGANWTRRTVNPEAYARFLIRTAGSIHRESRGTRVLGFSLCHCGVSPQDFVRRAMAVRGTRRAMDGFSYHAYRPSPNGQIGAAESLRRWVDRAGGRGLPLHLTEFGWGTCQGILRVRVCVSPRTQARHLTTSYRLFQRNRRRLRLASAYWFLMGDLCTGDRCGWAHFGYFGLLTEAGTPKPAWLAYRAWARR